MFNPIGIIYSEHKEEQKTPIQPIFAKECEGYIEINKEFEEAYTKLWGKLK